jgi:hypothetical protein
MSRAQRLLLLGGLAALAAGQAAVAAAFPIPGLFMPGVWLVGLGLLACAAAGVLGVAQPTELATTPAPARSKGSSR